MKPVHELSNAEVVEEARKHAMPAAALANASEVDRLRARVEWCEQAIAYLVPLVRASTPKTHEALDRIIGGLRR